MAKIHLVANRQTLYNSNIFIVVAMFLFFRPGMFTYVPQFSKIDLILSILLPLCCAVIIVMHISLIGSFGKHNEMRYITLFFLILLFSSIYNNESVVHTTRTLFYLYAFCLFCCDGMRINSEKFLSCVSRLLFALVFINLAMMIVFPDGIYNTEYYHNNIHFLGSKNGFINYVLPLLVVLLIEWNHKMIGKIYFIAGIIIGVITTLIGESSTSVIAIFILGCFVVLHRKGQSVTSKFGAVYICLFCASLGITVFRIQNYFAPLIETFFDKSADLTGRTDIWDIAIQMIKEQPVLGYGLNLINGVILKGQTYYYSHNLILEILLSGGLIALIVFIMIFVHMFKEIHLSQISDMDLNVVLSGIAAYLTLSLTEAPITTKGLYMLIIICLAMTHKDTWLSETK